MVILLNIIGLQKQRPIIFWWWSMIIMTNLFRRSLWLGIGVLGWGFIYARAAHSGVGWPWAIVLGLCFSVLMLLLYRRQFLPAPFRLVIHLADDDVSDSDDDKMFELLHARFKAHSTAFKFDGFDIGGGYVWFYFRGADAKSVHDAVLSLVTDCTFREGSYFEIGENDRLPIPAV
jgi:hypothetical protein